MPENDFEKISKKLMKKDKNIESSNMFGKECLKINGKAFAAFHQKKMVFKLTGSEHEKAIGLSGSRLWDPSGKKRPMKEWVQVTPSNSELWEKLAVSSAKYVDSKA